MVRIGEVETALRAQDLVNRSFRGDKQRSKYVSPAKLIPTPDGYTMTTITKVPGERARAHAVHIEMEPGYKGRFNKCPHVRIDCDCMRHLFVWNYALLQKDSALVDHTNGQPPVITNPAEVPGCCKHAIVAIRYLMKSNPTFNPPVNPGKDGKKVVRLKNLKTALKRVINRR